MIPIHYQIVLQVEGADLPAFCITCEEDYFARSMIFCQKVLADFSEKSIRSTLTIETFVPHKINI